MTLDKNTSQTNADNYLGGASNYTHTRMYANQKLSFTPASGKTITSVVITANSTSYANNYKNGAWTNATATSSASTVTITPVNGSTAFYVVLGSATRCTQVTVNYSE